MTRPALTPIPLRTRCVNTLCCAYIHFSVRGRTVTADMRQKRAVVCFSFAVLPRPLRRRRHTWWRCPHRLNKNKTCCASSCNICTSEF